MCLSAAKNDGVEGNWCYLISVFMEMVKMADKELAEKTNDALMKIIVGKVIARLAEELAEEGEKELYEIVNILRQKQEVEK